jgi:NTP pyrophosphatase (non-canonical NTP hydrolase)
VVTAPSNLSVLLTSPRVPAGLLTGGAWRLLHRAAVIATADPESPVARAVTAEGLLVTVLGAVTPAELLALAATQDVVWMAADDGDEGLVRSLAAEIVARSERAPQQPAAPSLEVVVGSYDPVGARLLDLVEVMDRLRRECPWDKEQTHESLVRYLIEESYETVEAIESGDREHLEEELGDLLLQVMFHARIASEDPDRPFGIDEVAAAIVEKLVRRHPHVFGDVDASDAAAVEANWETIKAAEKSRDSAVDGIPLGLPALSLAAKVVDRAARGSVELSVPVPGESAYTAETLGEVLFALVAAAQAAGLDPEQALRQRVRTEMDAIRAGQRAVSDR